jgi:hypothetical protein
MFVRLMASPMNKLLLTVVVASVAGWANGTQDDQAASAAANEDLNVNSRYTVERVAVKRDAWQERRISLPLQKQIDEVVGQNLNQENLESLATSLQKELRVPKVSVKVAKGHMPDRVVVTFETAGSEKGFDLDLDRFLYHSKQGWTGEGGLAYRLKGNRFTFGLVSDADRLLERYAGIQTGYERYSLGTDRVGFRFRYLDYHEQWNLTTLEAAKPGELYRERQHFVPEVIFRLAEPLEWTAGVDFARYETFLPNPVAQGLSAGTESSNAAVTTLRYRQRWGSDGDPYKQDLQASYGVRSGTSILGSDALFTRQFTDAKYTMKHGRQTLKAAFIGGSIAGTAPMYERFVLGNAETLRGWNKFDINPTGATRVVHGSVEYIYRMLLFFFDTGAAWNVGEDPEARQSAGVGLHAKGFEFAVGFPLRAGVANPVVYVGMNF